MRASPGVMLYALAVFASGVLLVLHKVLLPTLRILEAAL